MSYITEQLKGYLKHIFFGILLSYVGHLIEHNVPLVAKSLWANKIPVLGTFSTKSVENGNWTKPNFYKFPLIVHLHEPLSIPKYDSSIVSSTPTGNGRFRVKMGVLTSWTRKWLLSTEKVYPATRSSQICSCRSKPYCLNRSSNIGTFLLEM